MSDENEGIIATLSEKIKKNWRLLLVGIIIIVIALNSSWADNKSSLENKSSTTPQAEQSGQTAQNKPEEKTQNTENNVNTIAQSPILTNSSANTNTDIVTETAAKSEGVTHLARKAIKKYLANTEETLNAEQKIYAEDYLKRQIGSQSLRIGQTLEFKTDLIKTGIDQAKALNQQQIENLSKYVPLARNLN